jgi:hypothetical protein
MRKLIGNLQLMMQGLSYLDFIRHLRIDLTLVSIQECKDNKSYKERRNIHDNSSQRIARKMNEKEK